MEKTCPHCEKHCTVDNLRCHNGREYFGIKEERHPAYPEEKMIALLRKCGHYLHHNVGRNGDVAPLLSALSPEERSTLEALLEKCLNNWMNLTKQS